MVAAQEAARDIGYQMESALVARDSVLKRADYDNAGCRWHMFEEKREAVMAIEAAALPLIDPLGAHQSFPTNFDNAPLTN